MAGKGIHQSFAINQLSQDYYETVHRAKARAAEFDEKMRKGKEEALRIRAALREIEKRKAAHQ